MADTYCGKSCEECAEREEMNCPGCSIGPGKKYGGNCKLAKCARDKGHEACDTCSFHTNCRTYANRYDMPEERRREREAEAMRKAAIARKAPILGKWLWILFWLIIPSFLGALMTNEDLVALLPGLAIPGLLIQLATSAAYGLILLKLGSEEPRYSTAGKWILIAAGLNAVIHLIPGSSGEPWTLLFTLPATVLGLIGHYNEYMGHAAVLDDIDYQLSEKWTKLWKWYIGCYLGLPGSILVVAIIPVIGFLALLAALIGLFITSILQIVYLYRTAKAFRDYPVDL